MRDPATAVHEAIETAAQTANPGTIVTGYALIIEGTDGTDTSAFIYDAAEGQSVAHTLGLLELGRRYHLGRVGDADTTRGCIRLTCDHPAGAEPEGHVQCDDEGPRGKLCTLHPGHDGNHQDGGTQWHY